jgi:hypothetical protein
MFGQTQKREHGREFAYYRHQLGRYEKCRGGSISAKKLENAVFRTIFENTVDVPAFEQAIQESLPDESFINSLEKQIKAEEKELTRIEKELDKFVDAVVSGTLKKDTVKKKEKSLTETKSKVTSELQEHRAKLRSMPDVQKVKAEAEQIRRQLLEHFSSEERMQQMGFDEKKQLLHWLFDGKDEKGTPYGIYISKTGYQKWDYFMYGRITGLRTIKGEDINYQAWDEGEKEYKTNKDARKLSYHGLMGKGFEKDRKEGLGFSVFPA